MSQIIRRPCREYKAIIRSLRNYRRRTILGRRTQLEPEVATSRVIRARATYWASARNCTGAGGNQHENIKFRFKIHARTPTIFQATSLATGILPFCSTHPTRLCLPFSVPGRAATDKRQGTGKSSSPMLPASPV
ncbi:uncharacterized protein BO95DRAFT_23855 [Aspergillus brunneoviolaceus CBS 621.78]|uniref:Uncharacterized protein n=1 Tax=Aspergillus brunneoviolaceus CBS 621.78 TaxID=1450534 RepID=A0ACD1GIJ3_9EURO|nr:hypothetical protein BO95DRAFT_23855 [Aspergillus brunneoviolaceus CBS 621.78]RAH48997.1 hypothetical protein BO95DRAFT_23855 [Aspergillus brunneoviolaceus CBS 621.78]